MEKLVNKLFTFLCVCVLTGCAAGTVVTGTTRPAIKPEQVTIYQEAPASFDLIAAVSAQSRFSGQKAMDRTIRELKEKAAKLGANGVVVTDAGVSTVYINGIPVVKTLANGRAIYVEKP